MNRAVLILAFNRPSHIEQICRAVRAAGTERAYIVCDGPRRDRPDDVAACAAVREAFAAFDFGCDVSIDLAPFNRGCRGNVVAALQWFFEHEAEGIVLEDDIIPAPAFFPFCWALLDRYREVPEVWSIGGTNSIARFTQSIGSDYYYSRFFEVWGWASWRSRWQNYDPTMRQWPLSRRRFRMGRVLDGWAMTQQFKHYFNETYSGNVDTWDYQRVFEQWQAGGLTIYPKSSLVANEGFGTDATHTFWQKPAWAQVTDAWRPADPPAGPARMAAQWRLDKEIGKWRFGANLKNVWQRQHPTSFGYLSSVLRSMPRWSLPSGS